MNINFGLKITGNNKKLLAEAVKLIEKSVFEYIELIITPNFNLNSNLINMLSNVKLIIHAPHENYGVDIGKIDRKNFTIKMIKKSLEWMKKLNAEYLVIHCGTGDLEVAKKNLRLFEEYKDMVLLENMPAVGINSERCLGYDIESFKKLNIPNFGLCLDFGHAIKASLSLNRNYIGVISDFMTFKPKMFHISDGKLDKEADEHLNIGDGEYDFVFIKEMIQKSESKFVTLETPRYCQSSLEDDIRNLKFFKNIRI